MCFRSQWVNALKFRFCCQVKSWHAYKLPFYWFWNKKTWKKKFKINKNKLYYNSFYNRKIAFYFSILFIEILL
jgi:hypothetical protein